MMRSLGLICLFCVAILLNFSCSTMPSEQTKNFIKHGEYELKGGKFGASWPDSLSFKRVTWFYELTSVYDLYYVHFNLQSPFATWLDEPTKQKLSQCEDVIITMSYALDDLKISTRDFNNQMNEAGHDLVKVDLFAKNLRMHPDYESQSFKLYEVQGHCKKASNLKGPGSSVMITFPGHLSVLL